MIAIIAIKPNGSSHSRMLYTDDKRVAQAEVSRMEREGYTDFQIVRMPK